MSAQSSLLSIPDVIHAIQQLKKVYYMNQRVNLFIGEPVVLLSRHVL